MRIQHRYTTAVEGCELCQRIMLRNGSDGTRGQEETVIYDVINAFCIYYNNNARDARNSMALLF